MPLTDTGSPPARSRPKSPLSAPVALGWGIAAATCAAGLWVALSKALTAFGSPDLPKSYVNLRLPDAWLLIACAAGSGGLLAGACVGLRRGRKDVLPSLILTLGAGAIGASAGALTLPVALACSEWIPQLVSAVLVWASAGFAAGLGGYALSLWTKPAEADEPADDEAERPPAAKVEWLLVEPKRPWRIDRALVRVLPVLAAAAWALLGAAVLAPSDLSVALLGIGILGLSVALVLYTQEVRIERLERHFRGRRD